MSKNNHIAEIVSCETFTERLTTELHKIDLAYNKEWLFSLYNFYKKLIEWNKTHNLTRITLFEDFLFKHLLDSLLLLKTPLDFKNHSFADVGSGAGFPGIPLSIFLQDTKITLIEKLTKKTSFLHFVKADLGLNNISVENKDVSLVDKKYDFISLRAVNVERDFLNSLKKNLSPKGSIILYLSEEQENPNINLSADTYHFSLSDFSRKITVYSY